VPGRDDAHPQPAPPDRRRLGRHPPRRGPPREVGPPDRRRRGQTARGTPGVGAGAGTPAVALADGDLVGPHGSPPRTDPAGRHDVILCPTTCIYMFDGQRGFPAHETQDNGEQTWASSKARSHSSRVATAASVSRRRSSVRERSGSGGGTAQAVDCGGHPAGAAICPSSESLLSGKEL